VAYFLTALFGFFAIFQPGVLWPALASARPLFLVGLLGLLAWAVAPKNPDPLRPRARLSHFITGFVGAQILSVLQFLYIPILIDTVLIWGVLLLGYFLISSQINTPARLQRFWAGVLLAAAWLAGHAVWVYHTQPLTHPQLTGGRLSSYGAYSGANDLALIAVCAWPLIFKFLDLQRNAFVKAIVVLALVVLLYADLRTLSRAGLIGLSLVMGLSLLRGRSLGKMGRWVLLIPAVIVVFIVGSKLLLTRSDAKDFTGQDESVQHRYDAWYAGYQMLKSSPLVGVGSGNFVALSKDFGAGMKIQAHNTIIKVFAETGLLGGICYLGILITAFRLLWRNWRRFQRIKPEGPEFLWAEALGISLIGFCFNTLFSVKAHEWFLYMVVASATALDRLYPREALLYALKAEKAMEALTEPPPAAGAANSPIENPAGFPPGFCYSYRLLGGAFPGSFVRIAPSEGRGGPDG
jgi:O-antigen ligase